METVAMEAWRLQPNSWRRCLASGSPAPHLVLPASVASTLVNTSRFLTFLRDKGSMAGRDGTQLKPNVQEKLVTPPLTAAGAA